MRKRGGFTLLGLLAILLLGLALVNGWVMNLVDIVIALVHGDPLTTLLLGRFAGLFIAPLGAILGYF